MPQVRMPPVQFRQLVMQRAVAQLEVSPPSVPLRWGSQRLVRLRHHRLLLEQQLAALPREQPVPPAMPQARMPLVQLRQSVMQRAVAQLEVFPLSVPWGLDSQRLVRLRHHRLLLEQQLAALPLEQPALPAMPQARMPLVQLRQSVMPRAVAQLAVFPPSVPWGWGSQRLVRLHHRRPRSAQQLAALPLEQPGSLVMPQVRMSPVQFRQSVMQRAAAQLEVFPPSVPWGLGSQQLVRLHPRRPRLGQQLAALPLEQPVPLVMPQVQMPPVQFRQLVMQRAVAQLEVFPLSVP
eukprot:jgi/Undpi1/9696/HiC_scaffold_27.g12152.m1